MRASGLFKRAFENSNAIIIVGMAESTIRYMDYDRCRYCRDSYSLWRDLAKALKGKAQVGKICCSEGVNPGTTLNLILIQNFNDTLVVCDRLLNGSVVAPEQYLPSIH